MAASASSPIVTKRMESTTPIDEIKLKDIDLSQSKDPKAKYLEKRRDDLLEQIKSTKHQT